MRSINYKKLIFPILFGTLGFSDIYKPQKVFSDYSSSFTGSFNYFSESNPTPTGFDTNAVYGSSNLFWDVEFSIGDQIEIGTYLSNVDTTIQINDPSGGVAEINDDIGGELDQGITTLFDLPAGENVGCNAFDFLCSRTTYTVTTDGTLSLIHI